MSKGINFLLIFCYLLGLTLFSCFVNGFHLEGTQDAHFQLVYMQNLSDGNGLVLQVGDLPFKAYSSLLWIMIGSLFYFATENPEICLIIFNLFLLSYSLLKINLLIKKLKPPSLQKVSLFFFAALALTPGFCDWIILSLQEYGLWTSLILLLFAEIFENQSDQPIRNQFYVLLILLSLTHQASWYWGTFFLAAAFTFHYKRESSARIAWSIVRNSIFFFVIVQLVIWFWQNRYFEGSDMHFFAAKSIIEVFKQSLLSNAMILSKNLMLLLFVVLLIYYYRKKIKQKIRSHYLIDLVGMFFLFYMFQPFFVSPDFARSEASIQICLPIFYLGLLCLILEFKNLAFRKFVLPFLFLTAFFAAAYNYLNTYVTGNNDYKTAICEVNTERLNGHRMNVFFDADLPLPSVFDCNNGAFAYTYNGKYIDSKFCSGFENAKKTFFAEQIDLVGLQMRFLTGSESRKKIYFNKMDQASIALLNYLKNHPKFKINYQAVVLHKKNTNHYLALYASRNFLVGLDSKYYTFREIN